MTTRPSRRAGTTGATDTRCPFHGQPFEREWDACVVEFGATKDKERAGELVVGRTR